MFSTKPQELVAHLRDIERVDKIDRRGVRRDYSTMNASILFSYIIFLFDLEYEKGNLFTHIFHKRHIVKELTDRNSCYHQINPSSGSQGFQIPLITRYAIILNKMIQRKGNMEELCSESHGLLNERRNATVGLLVAQQYRQDIQRLDLALLGSQVA